MSETAEAKTETIPSTPSLVLVHVVDVVTSATVPTEVDSLIDNNKSYCSGDNAEVEDVVGQNLEENNEESSPFLQQASATKECATVASSKGGV